jgi:hypothetical protein
MDEVAPKQKKTHAKGTAQGGFKKAELDADAISIQFDPQVLAGLTRLETIIRDKVRIPGEGERDSGVKVNAVPG